MHFSHYFHFLIFNDRLGNALTILKAILNKHYEYWQDHLVSW